MNEGQLTGCESLHEICLCLDAHKGQLYHWGFRNTVTISSLSRANENRDYRIYEDMGKYLINHVRPMYSKVRIADVILDKVIYALDSTTISTSINWRLGH